jgi:hypothetical protein
MSEFNLNPEIYGYITKNIAQWTLPSQNLDFEICQSISNDYNQLHEKRNKFSAFFMCNMLNIGIPLEHLLKYTQFEILQMYNIKELNDKKINDYKKMLTP